MFGLLNYVNCPTRQRHKEKIDNELEWWLKQGKQASQYLLSSGRLVVFLTLAVLTLSTQNWIKIGTDYYVLYIPFIEFVFVPLIYLVSL